MPMAERGTITATMVVVDIGSLLLMALMRVEAKTRTPIIGETTMIDDMRIVGERSDGPPETGATTKTIDTTATDLGLILPPGEIGAIVMKTIITDETARKSIIVETAIIAGAVKVGESST